jgi:hypothetical protein
LDIGYLGVGREEEERDGFMILDFGFWIGKTNIEHRREEEEHGAELSDSFKI